MNPVKLFISYAREDEALEKAFINHMSGLQRLQLVETWDDQQISPGLEWDQAIKNALEAADIVIFLISADFAASNYIHDVEIKNALDRYNQGDQIIIPVLIRPYDFQSLSLSKFQALPDNAKPVTSWDNQDEAWLNVTLGIKKVIYEIRGEVMHEEEEPDAEENLGNVPKIILHDFHQYTCNRREQFVEFEEHQDSKPKAKMQFYYVLGEEEQSHYGLVNRLAYELGGHLLDIDNPTSQNSKLLIDEIILENLRDLSYLKKNLVRKLLATLNIDANASDPILTKNLEFICKESPVVKKMNAADSISILIRIYEDEWDEEEIPALIKWFLSDFCNTSLPEEAPTFLFFFGIIYDEKDPEVINSVKEAIVSSELIKAGRIKPLSELEMVTQKDLTRWFRKYKLIAPDKEIRQSYLDTYFKEDQSFHMDKVQRSLKEIIDQFNKPNNNG